MWKPWAKADSHWRRPPPPPLTSCVCPPPSPPQGGQNQAAPPRRSQPPESVQFGLVRAYDAKAASISQPTLESEGSIALVRRINAAIRARDPGLRYTSLSVRAPAQHRPPPQCALFAARPPPAPFKTPWFRENRGWSVTAVRHRKSILKLHSIFR